VKHGDLDSSLIGASRDYDVHMSPEGAGFLCQDCHVTEKHVIKGNAFAVSPGHVNPVGCTDCHDVAPHENEAINDHERVACQTCHIPTFAKGLPTKVYWDWSVAGRDLPSDPDQYGLPTYAKAKGRFVWAKNVEPDYAWYDGTARTYSMGEPIDPDQTVALTEPVGSIDEPEAQIYPFKVHEGRQIYDKELDILIAPKLYGEGGFWKTFDWDRAAELGMASAGQPYSGEYGFVDTKMYWRLNHMVVPGELALRCRDCHAAGKRLDWVALGYGDDPIRLRRAEKAAEEGD
jgi:octaheme c-type cytochrome (tetrathionate reductase family)